MHGMVAHSLPDVQLRVSADRERFLMSKTPTEVRVAVRLEASSLRAIRRRQHVGMGYTGFARMVCLLNKRC